MPVFQQGSVNTTALIVPDLYVQVVPPQVTTLNGVATNIVGMVGTASWGPVNSPVTISDMSSYAGMFGPIMPRKYDLGTAIAAAVIQGANNFRCVRVTDGTDVAASVTVECENSDLAIAFAAAVNNGTSGKRGRSQLVKATVNDVSLMLTAVYTGSYGNGIQIVVGAGSAANTSKLSIAAPGGVPEVFDNISTTSSSASTVNLANGADGAALVSTSALIGTDVTPRKGMYALRGTKVSIAALVDGDDTTQWSTQVAFGLSEGVYMILVGPAGQTITEAIAAKATAGVDSYAAKVLHGDYCFFQDNVNRQLRLISPQGYVGGVLANLSPEQSSLNKPIYSIVDTQSTANNKIYSSAELGQLTAAGIDLITNPCPGGSYFGCRIGHNSSSNADINGDNYTRMTNYNAYTLNAGMGKFIGRLGSSLERKEAWATLDTFFSKMKNRKPEPMISDYDIAPIPALVNGFQLANVTVQYLDIVEKFIISVQGGTTVQIIRTSTTSA